jgi:hypothetical protein
MPRRALCVQGAMKTATTFAAIKSLPTSPAGCVVDIASPVHTPPEVAGAGVGVVGWLGRAYAPAAEEGAPGEGGDVRGHHILTIPSRDAKVCPRGTLGVRVGVLIPTEQAIRFRT